MYILSPHAAGILYAHLVYAPPPLEGYFQGWGVGVYKNWPYEFIMCIYIPLVTSNIGPHLNPKDY